MSGTKPKCELISLSPHVLRLFEEIRELDLPGELWIERVLYGLGATHLLVLLAAKRLEVDDHHGVRLGEHVHITEIAEEKIIPINLQ